jgi:sugar phosphate isomerase/epimerase
MPYRFRHATCNEYFDKWAFAPTCRAIQKAGYEGIEIAPYTLGENPHQLPAADRAELRHVMADHGLTFVGLHWLLVGPQGIHVTTPDAAVREKSWDYIRHLIDLCADLGPRGVMVFGSPKQRGTTGGATREQAVRNFVEGMASVATHAEQRGVSLLIEALPANQTDVISTLDEAVSLVKEINSPAVATMFDSHNAVDELEPHAALIEKHFAHIRHVHVNETDGKHCGKGDYDFSPVLGTLARLNYKGWVSLEAFDFSFGGETIANESLRYLERKIAALGVSA